MAIRPKVLISARQARRREQRLWTISIVIPFWDTNDFHLNEWQYIMNFTYGRYSVFQKIDARLLSIRAGLDRYIMAIEVVFTPSNPPQGVLVIDDLRIGVSFGNEKKKVGVARPSADSDSFIALRQLKTGQQEVRQQLELYLSPSTLEALEACRNGSDAILQLRVSGTITGYATAETEPGEKGQGIPWQESVFLNAAPSWVFKPERGSHDLVLKVSQSDWVVFLEQAGYRKTVLVEIKLPDDGALADALKHMEDARAAFLEGRYADAVAGCRKALETAISDGDCPWQETKDRNSRENMRVEARFRLSWCAIRHITHLAHHSNGTKPEFTRPMAQYVLGATYLALSLLSKEHDLFVKPEQSSVAE